MITGERLTSEKWQGRERGPSASSPDNSSHHASPQRRSDPPPEDPLDINGNRSSSEGPLNDTTGSNSQETVFASESRGYERDRGDGMPERERHRDSSRPASPRARSSSRHRYAGNSPDARSKPPASPGAERLANRELRRVNDEGASGEAASLPSRGSPVPHSSRERRGHNGETFFLPKVAVNPGLQTMLLCIMPAHNNLYALETYLSLITSMRKVTCTLVTASLEFS